MVNTKTPPQFLLIFLFLLFSFGNFQAALASDLAKEKRWAEQVIDGLLDGEAIYLNNGKHDFLAIETHADEPNQLGVIVLHGSGVHPDWAAVIQPLRVELAGAKWNTLSLQLPVLENGVHSKEYDPLMVDVPARIDAGIRQLAKQGSKKIAIVAHSLGAKMASYYLSNKKVYQESLTETPIVAFISIGMGDDDKNYLSRVKIPILDIIGEDDLEEVISSASKRVKALANNNFKQIVISDANHFFDDHAETLIDTVSEFLNGF